MNMNKNYLVLKFEMYPLVHSLVSEQEAMLRWCKTNGFEMTEQPNDGSIMVKFERDQKTLDFIKHFLEWKVKHALPFDSLKTMAGVSVVNLDN